MRTRMASPSDAGQPPRRLDAVEARHADVHEDDRRAQAPRLVDGLAAVGRLAHHLDVRRRLEQLAKAGADQGLVVGDEHARAHVRGRCAWIAKPPPSRAPVWSAPPYSATRSRIPISPWPAPSRLPLTCTGPRPSSRTSTSSARERVAQDDLRVRGAGVLEGVGQPLLHDAVGAQVDAGGQRHPLALDGERDRQPRPLDLLDEDVDVLDARLGLELGAVVLAAQHAQQPARLDQRLAPGLLDRGQRLARRRLLGAQRMALGAGLDDHHADVVRHEIVQLARDAGALLGHRLVRAQLVLALEQLGAGGERVGAQLAAADGAADEDHREDRGPREDGDAVDVRLRAEQAQRGWWRPGRRCPRGSAACPSRRRSRRARTASRCPGRGPSSSRRRGRARWWRPARPSRPRAASGAAPRPAPSSGASAARPRPAGPAPCRRTRPAALPPPRGRRPRCGRASRPWESASSLRTLTPRGGPFICRTGDLTTPKIARSGEPQIAPMPDDRRPRAPTVLAVSQPTTAGGLP